MSSNNEQQLMQRLSQGDQTAFRALFEAYYPRVRTFVVHIVKDENEAEDITQSIFVKIWERRDLFQHDDVMSFRGYIYRMARNASLNSLRRADNLNLDVAQFSESLTDKTSDEELYYAREKELFIKLVVCKMPAQRRRIFEMSRYGGMDNQAIAEELNLSKKTVENHLTLALKELRHALAAFSVLLFIG